MNIPARLAARNGRTHFHPAARRKPPFTHLEMTAGKSIADNRSGQRIEPQFWASMSPAHQQGYFAMGKAALDAAFAEMGVVGKFLRWWFS